MAQGWRFYFYLWSESCGWVLCSNSSQIDKLLKLKQQQMSWGHEGCHLFCKHITKWNRNTPSRPMVDLGRQLQLRRGGLAKFILCLFGLEAHSAGPWLCPWPVAAAPWLLQSVLSQFGWVTPSCSRSVPSSRIHPASYIQQLIILYFCLDHQLFFWRQVNRYQTLQRIWSFLGVGAREWLHELPCDTFLSCPNRQWVFLGVL